MSSEPTALAVNLTGISKSYTRGDTTLTVLQKLSLQVAEGDFIALMGPSGSGKSTLLNIIAGLDRADEGSSIVVGNNLQKLSDKQLTAWRSRSIGFIFQFYNLIPVLTAIENVELPLALHPMSSKERTERAAFALSVVGLEGREHHLPRQLSGGQEQRVAIARAIVSDPRIIVADEPTGDLDRASADEILALLARLNKEFKKTIIMVTHDQNAANAASRIVRLDKGIVVNQ